MTVSRRNRGVALVVSLLLLLVVTVIGIIAAMNSSLGLRMAGNMQDAYDSFQAAEAGVYAALGLASTADDPFVRLDQVDPFADFADEDHPLNALKDGSSSVAVEVFLIAPARECPRPPEEGTGSSIGVFDCDFYRVVSEHDVDRKARTQVEMGVVKTVIGESG